MRLPSYETVQTVNRVPTDLQALNQLAIARNLAGFTVDISVDGQYARNCTVNCANRTGELLNM